MKKLKCTFVYTIPKQGRSKEGVVKDNFTPPDQIILLL